MTSLPWWKRGVIYQVAVPSFADSDGDGLGDLRGVIERLDHLSDGSPGSLGIDAIWLSPIHPSPRRDFGYDVADYRSIDPRFGTMEDFRALLDACHARGLRVMMDLVLNHTSDEHPWFVASRSSRDDPKRDWYVWRDGRGPGRPPNRWRSVVEGSAWERDAETGQYYYHSFLPFQPDLNWREPEVEAEMLAVADHWLAMGVDGFRLDLVNYLFEDAQLRDNPFKLGPRPYLAQRHLHDCSQPESVEAVKKLRRACDRYADRALMGEVITDRPEVCVAYLGDGTDALHLAFYLDFATRPWSAEAYRESVGWLEAHLPAHGWPCYYLNNHDIKRSYGRLGGRRDAEAKAKVTAAMLLTLRGTPIIYYGEEIGMPFSRMRRRDMDDPVGKRFWPFPVGRDGSRTPMQWSSDQGGGFTTGRPWLPVDPSREERNVAAESADPDSLLSWYRRLIRLRASRPALHAGDYRALDGVPRDVFAYARTTMDDEVAVILNFGSTLATVRASALGRPASDWETLLCSHERETRPNETDVRLRPFEAIVLARAC